MRRKLSSLFMLLAIPLMSQPVLNEVELSFAFRSEQNRSAIKAYLRFNSFANDSLRLLFHQSVDSVKLEQGRIKQKLAFRQNDQRLQISIPRYLDERSRIVVYYAFLWRENTSPYLQRSGEAWVLNALNLVEEEKHFAQPGFFYPVLGNSPHHLKVNINLPAQLNFELPGEVQFTLSEENQTHYFTGTAQALKPEAFYLVIGQFEEAKTFVEEEALTDELKRSLAALELEQKISPALDYFAAQTGRLLTENDLEKIAGLKRPDSAGFLLTRQEVQISADKFESIRAAALYFARGERARANELEYEYFLNSMGPEWEIRTLRKRLQGNREQGDFFWRRYLNRVLAQQKDELRLSDTAQLSASVQSREQAYLFFAREMYQRRKPVEIAVSYRYLGPQARQLLLFSQPDTNLRLALPLRVEVITATGETQMVDSFVALGRRDTLSIPLAGAPKSLRVHLDSLLPVALNDQRPQTYLLYDLAQAKSAAQRQKALMTLLDSSNPSLKATVIGIALDNPDVRVQMRAMQAVETLNPSGKARLEFGLRKLAEKAAVPIVQQKARELVNKLY